MEGIVFPCIAAGAIAVAMTVSACAVGPNFQKPAGPEGHGYTREPLPLQTESTATPGGQAQHFESDQQVPIEWWSLFGSEPLASMVDEALTHSPDLAARQAALRSAQEAVHAQAGVFFPQVQAGASVERQQISGAGLDTTGPGFLGNVFQANVNVSYALDLFGGERRQLEAARAQAAAQAYKLEASRLTLISNVVAAAIQWASLQDQIAATQEILDSERQQLNYIRRLLETGSRTRADVLQQEANLAAVEATLPDLQQHQAATEHALAVLTGHFPDEGRAYEVKLAQLTLPQELPVSLPSSLVNQRPDIKIQEMVVHEASARIGVATANLLPQLTLTGSYGRESLSSGTLFTPGTAAWNAVAGLTQPLFEGVTLRARRRGAIADYEAALAQYKFTVLQAFQNVADVLTALGHDAQALKSQVAAVDAAQASLDLIQRQYQAGAVDYVSLLTAQQTYQQARIASVRAVAQRYTDTVSLFQALGGGWQGGDATAG